MAEGMDEHRRELGGLRTQFLQNTALSAIGVAYFDFLVGLVGVIHGVVKMSKDSWYPFCLPVGRTPPMFGVIPLRFAEMGLYIAFAFLLIASIFLFSGILLRQSSLINVWYCPNAIFLVVHALGVFVGAFLGPWSAIASLSTLFGFRIFAVLNVYKFLKALGYYNRALHSPSPPPPPHYKEAMAFDYHRPEEAPPQRRPYELNNHHKMVINEEAKAVSGAILRRIENGRRYEDMESRGTHQEEPHRYFPTSEHRFENEQHQSTNDGVFHSALFFNAKARRQPPTPPPPPASIH